MQLRFKAVQPHNFSSTTEMVAPANVTARDNLWATKDKQMLFVYLERKHLLQGSRNTVHSSVLALCKASAYK